MKKLLSTILCLAMMLSLATPALAASSTTASGIRGEIIYYNQSIRGVPTQPTGRGKEHTLTGTYCFLDVTGSTKIKTEGYTVRDWGNPSMGRWMMYNVFGIDEAPTSWTNLD